MSSTWAKAACLLGALLHFPCLNGSVNLPCDRDLGDIHHTQVALPCDASDLCSRPYNTSTPSPEWRASGLGTLHAWGVVLGPCPAADTDFLPRRPCQTYRAAVQHSGAQRTPHLSSLVMRYCEQALWHLPVGFKAGLLGDSGSPAQAQQRLVLVPPCHSCLHSSSGQEREASG